MYRWIVLVVLSVHSDRSCYSWCWLCCLKDISTGSTSWLTHSRVMIPEQESASWYICVRVVLFCFPFRREAWSAWSLCRPPMTNVGAETASRHDHLQASPWKETSLEVRGQLLRSNLCRSSTASTYMLSVTRFRPKRNHFDSQSSRRAKFGHTGCWSIAKRRFSTKFSKSFAHLGKRNDKKIVSKNEKKPEGLGDLWKKIDEYIIDHAWEDGCVKIANMKSVKKCSSGGRCHVPTRTPCVCRFLFWLTANNRLWSPRPTAWS